MASNVDRKTFQSTGDVLQLQILATKQLSLHIVQKVKQKKKLSSLGRGYATASPSASRKQPKNGINNP
ncbi:hypothetical protein TNCV_1456551 [Trichonephila clavipes]|nr:hypothetical protein TNCV_1456551 [Trichonephila clavipes]